MKTEDFRLVIQRQSLDQLNHFRKFKFLRGEVLSTGREVVVPLHDIIIHVLLEERFDQAHIFVIGDSATIVDDSNNGVQGTIGDDGLLVNVHLQLEIGGIKVGIHPVIGNIPANWAEFTTL